MELIETIQETDDQIPIQNDLEKQFDVDIPEYLINQISRFLSNPDENLPLRVIFSRLLESKEEELSNIVKYSFEKGIPIWKAVHEDEILQQLGDSCSIILELQRVHSTISNLEDPKEKLISFIRILKPFHFLTDFLPEGSCKSTHDEIVEDLKSQKTGVRFITLHSSKGLDADFVFIPFLEESIGLPGNDIDEQRRLLYVALTRAKVGVVMTWAWSRRSDKRFKCSGTGGKVTHRSPSQFISQCGIHPNLVPPGSTELSAEVALNILDHHCKVLKAN
jgi:superfamily I DNA/RNA helicase